MASRVQRDSLKTNIVQRSVVFDGITDVMFDRYAGDNQTRLEPWQKLYFAPDGETLCLPALNIMSFLSAHNTNSAPKRLMDKRKFKDFANSMLSFVNLSPTMIPFLRDGAPIKFGKLEQDVDPLSGVYIHRVVARLDKGIPNPKERPVLPLPWSLAFTLTIYPNTEFQEQQLMNLVEAGGMALGLGTWRGVYGKFVVRTWE
jgi:hypothetical protein